MRPRLDASGEEVKEKDEIRDDKPRLYFDLKNADVIPLCMNPSVVTNTSRGPVEDLWDQGFTVYTYPAPSDPNKPPREPIRVSHVLIAAVGLLSLEWLIRKLLRLA